LQQAFNAYVICQKRTRGTAIIAREEFLDYSKSRRQSEFVFICWITCQADEALAVLRFPRIRWAINQAHAWGMGPGFTASPG
jgi:hypothetical protein